MAQALTVSPPAIAPRGLQQPASREGGGGGVGYGGGLTSSRIGACDLPVHQFDCSHSV